MASVVYIKNKNGKIYAYENVSYWDKESKITRHKRKCVGHLDPITKEIKPNRKKGDINTAPCGAVFKNRAKRACIVKSDGISLLLDQISNEIGLTKAIKKAFPEDWCQIMTCAYFLVSEGNALRYIEKWADDNISPYTDTLSSQRVSELLKRITRNRQLDFFSEWINANRNDEYYALDITSVSSYSEQNEFVRYGYNRDKEKLPQINMLLVSGEESKMPLYFKLLPGSIKDVSTLRETLDTLELVDTKPLHLVMDKGFYKQVNIDALYEMRTKFMIAVPFTTILANEQVQKARAQDIKSHHNYRVVFEDEVFVNSCLINWNGHRCYAHVYYDSLKAEIEYKKFNRLLYECHQELVSGVTIDSHKKFYKQFFQVKETPKRGRKVAYNQSAIEEYKNNTTGWLVMITNDVKDPVKALEIYRRKDSVEKAFDDLKNELDCKRLRIHSSKAMDGRLFLQFIALILTIKIRLTLNDAGWLKKYDTQQIINEMKSLRVVAVEGKKGTIRSVITALQEKIIALFGLQ